MNDTIKNVIQIVENRVKHKKTKVTESDDPFMHGKSFYFDHRIHNEEPTWPIAKTKMGPNVGL